MTSWTLEISLSAEKDLDWFVRHDLKLYKKCFDLTRDILKDPMHGLGKPEPLTGLPGTVWSRRVSDEHRMVYQIHNHRVVIDAYKGHYK